MTLKRDRFEIYVIGALLIVTLIALALQSVRFTKTLRIDAKTSFPFASVDDRANGGLSTSSVSIDGDKLILDCNIVPSSYAWPFCEITFNLIQSELRGTDLSRYNSVKLWIKYNAHQESGIRFQARNFNANYSRVGDEGSLKYNSIEFYEKKSAYPVSVPLANFQVPTWWLVAKEIPIEKMGVEFNNIHTIEVATGSSIKPGHYTLIVEKIEFIGQYLSDQNLYLLLLILWGSSAFIYFIDRTRAVQQQLHLAGYRQQELEALNRLLNVNRLQLEEKLARDPLTGVLNRDGVAKLFMQKADPQSPILLSLIFIDIDHFKRINDTFGHNLGDEVIIQFAKLLSENTRGKDVLARWGGEEFVLACPNIGLYDAAIIAEKLRTVIINSDWPNHLKVTASFGVAEMGRESPAEFIGRADAALYQAKARGRNCIEISQFDEE